MCLCTCVCVSVHVTPCREGRSCLQELKALTHVQRFSVGVMFLSVEDRKGESVWVCGCVGW